MSSLDEYIESEGKANRARKISNSQWDKLATAIKRGKTDDEIRTLLKRPDLDMDWFREVSKKLEAEIKALLDAAPELSSLDFN